MAVQRKIFRIEQGGSPGGHAADSGREAEAAMRHHEFMTEIRALRSLIGPRGASPDRGDMERARAQISEAQAYKAELELIHAALKRGRGEAASLGACGALASDISRTGRELAAVVSSTEQATQQVLQAAEEIDQAAGALAASLKGGYENGVANDIRDRVVQIYEACNFQDLTGQRVGKVVELLASLECHVGRMMEIWSRIERFEPIMLDDGEGDHRLLNGPKLAGDAGHSTQNDIDVLFD